MAVDSRPVFVLFLLLSPTPREHLQILSRLSFCVRDDAFVAFLKDRPDTDDFFARIAAFEQALDQKGLV
jgi:PTS system nitrogen regulatory IIA component